MMIDCSRQIEQQLTLKYWMSLGDFCSIVTEKKSLTLDGALRERLNSTRVFIDELLSKKVKVYGLTTGFADLRNTSVDADFAALLSQNMIRSHDAGIGKSLSSEVTFGAMCLRAHSLSKGYSGFSLASMETLLGLIREEIIPEIPCSGSLGASGDLAFLARLGRAMMGDPVPVTYRGQKMLASDALRLAGITPMQPQAKEGLALTNGTSFMASMLASAYLQQQKFLKNLFALTGLFLNSVSAIDAAFYDMVHLAREQTGQIQVARLLRPFLPEADATEVQNDYCIRCLPQIYGPKIELIGEQKNKIEKELNAITDNPLIFRGAELSSDVHPSRLIHFNGSPWAVISGGNFHGENAATIADAIAMANAKIGLTIERQLTYMLNPFRNKNKLPIYLVADAEKAGCQSGHMITQYTGNALAHKIALLAQPASASNITSANESEDVVSYGATAAHKLLTQIEHLNELLSIYLTTTAQAYSLARQTKKARNPLCEEIFHMISQEFPLPQKEDASFDEKYVKAAQLLESGRLCLTEDVIS